jgi:uncharacterized protein (TIGR00288 family)
MNEENLCILIDFENIAAGTEREHLGKFNIKLVMNHLKEKGRVVISRAYGDWGRFAKFKQSLLEQGISMMELTSYRGQDKNRADIALVVDAMELVYSRPHIKTFVLLSGDSDFTPLVMKLRELNKRIIGLGTRKATSRLLANSCDEFIFYDNLQKRSHRDEESTDDTNTSTSPKPLRSQEAFALLVETIKVIQRDEPRPVSAGMIKQFILRKNSTFDETDFGYSGFTDFLEAAAKAKLVNLVTNDKGGGYVVSIKETASGPVRSKIDLPKYKHAMTSQWFELLIQKGFHPTNHFIRHTVVHEFVDHVLERRARKKRSTLVFTYGDIARRCRKTDPSATTSEVDHILNALYKAGELYGNDQKPIRSRKANFTVKKDAEELLKRLRIFYAELLLETLSLSEVSKHSEALCELLWGDTAHLSETQEILNALSEANRAAHAATNSTEQSQSSTITRGESTPATVESPSSDVKGQETTASTNSTRKVETKSAISDEPKKSTTPKRKTTQKSMGDTVKSEDKPKQTTRRRTAKKTPPKATEKDADKGDKSNNASESESAMSRLRKKTTQKDASGTEDKPKQTTRRRTTKKTPPKATEKDAAADKGDKG